MKSDSTMESQVSITVAFFPRVRARPLRTEPRPSGRDLWPVPARFLKGAARKERFSTTLVVAAVAVALTAGCSANPFAARDTRFDPIREGEGLDTRAGVNDPDVLSAIEEFLERTAEYGMEESAAAPAGADAALTVPARSNVARAQRSRRPWVDEPIRANAPVAAGVPVEMMSMLALPVVGSVAIRPVADREAARVLKPKRPAPNIVNMPLDVQGTQRPVDLTTVVVKLEEEARDSGDFDAEWRLRLTQLALHRDEEAARLPADLPGGAMLAALMRTASAVRRVARDPSGPGEEAVTSVETLARMLTARADPQVTTIRMCRKVVTFGVYEEMLDSEFVAGRTVRTIVYTELRNLRSEQTDDGQFRTNLATRIEVLSVDGTSVWNEKEPEIIDLCRVPRKDFFVAQRIALPPTLPAGDYVLKVLVEDKLSGKADEGTRAFSLRSQFSIATGG